jgi:RimJ/RimL family protein N-acetyltransferase
MTINDRYALRRFTPEDAPTLQRWFNDPDITQYKHRHSEIATQPAAVKEAEELSQNKDLFIVLDNGTPVGYAGFYYGKANEDAQMGLIVYDADIVEWLLRFGFTEKEYYLIKAEVYSNNKKAMALYAAAGMKTAIVQREALLRGQKRYDAVYFDMLDEEWRERHGAL